MLWSSQRLILKFHPWMYYRVQQTFSLSEGSTAHLSTPSGLVTVRWMDVLRARGSVPSSQCLTKSISEWIGQDHMHLNTQLMPAADPLLPYSCSWERQQHGTPFHALLGLVLSRHILIFVVQLNECCTILNLNCTTLKGLILFIQCLHCRYNDVLADTFYLKLLGFEPVTLVLLTHADILDIWMLLEVVDCYFVIIQSICSSFLRVDSFEMCTGSKQLVPTQNSSFECIKNIGNGFFVNIK